MSLACLIPIRFAGDFAALSVFAWIQRMMIMVATNLLKIDC